MTPHLRPWGRLVRLARDAALLLLTAAAALFAAAATVPRHCDPRLLDDPTVTDGNLRYQLRPGGWCEGLYARRDSRQPFRLAALGTTLPDDFLSRTLLRVAWFRPAGSRARVEATARSRSGHYRLDMVLPSAAKASTVFSWSSAVLRAARVEPNQLYLKVWTTDLPTRKRSRVFLPVFSQRDFHQRSQDGVCRIEAVLVPDSHLASLGAIASRGGKDPACEMQVPTRRRYAAGRPVRGLFDCLREPGLYRVRVHGTPVRPPLTTDADEEGGDSEAFLFYLDERVPCLRD